MITIRIDTAGYRKMVFGVNRIIRKPITDEVIQKIRNGVIKHIRGTASDSIPRANPYHFYPPRSFRLERSLIIQNIEGNRGLRISSNVPYAGILEEGRRRLWKRKRAFVFQGAYPNPLLIKKPSRFLSRLRYGVYTVFTKRIRRISPYYVFSKAAEMAKKEIVNNIGVRVKKVEVEGG